MLSARAALWTAALALLGACNHPAELPPTAGGLARGDAARLSLLVTQTRAQRPELSATELKQGPQEAAAEGPQLAELALRGEGVGLSPGIQVGSPEPIKLSLFLDKSRYHAGYALLSVGGAPEETWRIIGYDLRGEVTGDFELLYALADPESRVRYLAVLGGVYGEKDRRQLAYEGTLIVPGQGVRIENWERIYKIDFGFRFPAEPLFYPAVDRVNGILPGLQRAVAGLEALRNRAEQARRERDALAQQNPTPEQARRREQELARLDQQIAQLRAEQERAAKEAEHNLIRYWGLRASIDADFAEFAESNAFHWREPAQQRAWYGHWKMVEFHHPRIDELQRTLAGFLPDGTAMDLARDKAMAVINRLNNWARNPSRGGAPAR